jgi:hypothetical protein
MQEFAVKDCALLVRMSGLPPAMNLRELRERVAVADGNVLYHHFFETPLRHTFDDPFYRNDFAVWASLRLRDPALAERLGIIDPYAFESIEALRAATLEIVDDRLSETAVVPWAGPGEEFFFAEAITVVFDTGKKIRHPRELPEAIQRMTGGSIYFHFLEARRREPLGLDDFSAWFSESAEEFAAYRAALQAIDFYFSSLAEIRESLAQAFRSAGDAR